jgi:hypothetical protein
MKSRRFLITAAAAIAFAGGAPAKGQLVSPQSEPSMKPFSMDHRRGALARSPMDVSFLLDAPAGKHGFIQMKDGHLATGDGRRIRFWGVNITDWSKGSQQIPSERGLGLSGFNAGSVWSEQCSVPVSGSRRSARIA